MENQELIRFNKPFISGNEMNYINDAILRGSLSGNGYYTKACQRFFEQKYGFEKTLLTTSCTDALEMCAILANIQAGDEVIVPSYTFVSSALPFIRMGAVIIFADSKPSHPCIDESKIESLITSKTKAIVVVHYAGVACEMDEILNIADRYNLLVIEDAAQAINSFYKGKPLGGIGHLAAFSFHETKNIISGEGGLLIVNDKRFIDRSEIIWEKGTNRSSFFRGEVNKYGWCDTGSSFLASEMIAAFLMAQLESIDTIQEERLQIWNWYYSYFIEVAFDPSVLPVIPAYSTNNAHMFYILCKSAEHRDKIIRELKSHNISAVFHYLSLHSSPFYQEKYEGPSLVYSDFYSDNLLRLPFYIGLTEFQVQRIVSIIKSIY